jgi:epoxyqueuosine reductase QueG
MDANPLEDALGQPAEGEVIETAVEEPVIEAPAETPVTEALTPEPPAKTEVSQVPISALLDERDKRQKAEGQVQAQRYDDNLRFSRKFAEREYGKALIATVHDWAVARCDADPIFNAQMRSSEDPYEAAVQAYNRDQLATKVTPERFAAFEAWEKAQAELSGQPPPSPQTPAAPTPPRSLADAPGTGLAGKAALEVADGSAFAAAFK